jgi:23S rRNA (pseudouridine1915-N3)-methyltransferase
MKIKLLVVGKTDNIMLLELIETFEKRINRYLNFSIEIIPDSKQRKKLSKEKQKSKEGELIINKLMANDRMFLFDENGKSFSSVDFSNLIQKQMNSGIKQIVMVIGGPYGFSNSVYEKAYSKISLSKMTFTHQMVRLIAVEQIYRGLTILKNEPYHHQ